MCSVLFLKGPTYEMSQLVSQHNPNAFYYSFEFEGRNSIFNYLFAVNTPPFPPGTSRISYFTSQNLVNTLYFRNEIIVYLLSRF
jgi:hypothetical protein